jgi:hypothetical protein
MQTKLEHLEEDSEEAIKGQRASIAAGGRRLEST